MNRNPHDDYAMDKENYRDAQEGGDNDGAGKYSYNSILQQLNLELFHSCLLNHNATKKAVHETETLVDFIPSTITGNTSNS